MPKLFIIGNGFDLAHGYKTSYNDYFKFLLESQARSNKYVGLFKISRDIFSPDVEIILQKIRNDRSLISFSNEVLKSSFDSYFSANWCDIEQEYFKILSRYTGIDGDNRASFGRVPRLNEHFQEIRLTFEDYLKRQVFVEDKEIINNQDIQKLISVIQDSDGDTLVLNFNYSRIVHQYFESLSKERIINIHGELNNLSNPIVFGYAAAERASRILGEFGNDSFLMNIKRFMYRTDVQSRLNAFLDRPARVVKAKIDVIILGHSCGMSDRLVLQKIFNHENTRSILPIYYDNYSNYQSQMFNIHRLSENDNVFERLIDFESCPSFPQFGVDWSLECEQKIKKFNSRNKVSYVPDVTRVM